MVSVCIATKNGSRYLGEQLRSIMDQIGVNDEIVITDDGSTDDTVSVIKNFNDPRIRLFERKHTLGIVRTFEESLQQSKGDLIFLADQDDVWLPGKVDLLTRALVSNDFVISDVAIVDEELKRFTPEWFVKPQLQKGLFNNLLRNSYMGCCMAFKRNVLQRALPFPPNTPMHDLWIGLVAELYFKTAVLPEKLVLHRRHNTNASTTSSRSKFPLHKKFSDRYHLLKNLIRNRAYAG